jgi:hypothetical protein
MLPDNLVKYLRSVENAVRGLADSYVERYEEEHLTSNRVNLRIRIRFDDGYLLELNESATAEGKDIKHLGYRYHFQDEKNNLVLRYDNTPHFPNLESFPNHKHSSSGVIATKKPSIIEAIQEAAHIKKRSSKT